MKRDLKLEDLKERSEVVPMKLLSVRVPVDLIQRIDDMMPVDPTVRMQLHVPLSDGRTLALVHARGRVLASEVQDSKMWIDAELPESLARRLNELSH